MFKLIVEKAEKAEEPEIKLPTSAELSKKQESSRKTSLSAIDYAKAFDCVDHHKLWKVLKEMLGKNEGKSKSRWQRMRWLNSITDSEDMNLSKFQEMVKTEKPGMVQSIGSQGVGHDSATEQPELIQEWKPAHCASDIPVSQSV